MKTPLCSLAELWRGHHLNRILARAITLGCLAASAKSVIAQSWTATTAPVANWVSVASSADGNKLAALVENGGAVYTSTNAGATWTLSSPANGPVMGSSIASSADGNILFAAGFTDSSGALAGQIYRSTNSGATWSLTAAPYKSWTSIACSADGTQVSGASFLRRSFGAGILTSPDEGVTWTFTTAPNESWVAIASSADGGKLVAADGGADAIYTSTEAGNTWNQDSPPLQAFSSVASSADGSRLVAASENNGSGNGPIFVSTNSGLNWTQTTAPIANWVTVASSVDGRMLIAAGGGSTAVGHLYLSTDSGATWNQTNVLLTHWTSVAASADGSKLVAVDFNGHIYTLHLSPVTTSPALGIKTSGGNIILSWLVPSLNFVLQQSADFTTSNWTDVTAAPVLNTANLHDEVTVPNTGGSAYYRLVARAGSTVGGTGTQAIANVLRGPWQTLVVSTLFTPTFNTDGTFTATIQSPSGVITTDSGTWALTPPLVPSGFSNPEGHLMLTNTQGTVLLSGDVLLINPDQLVMLSAANSIASISPVPNVVISKFTP